MTRGPDYSAWESRLPPQFRPRSGREEYRREPGAFCCHHPAANQHVWTGACLANQAAQTKGRGLSENPHCDIFWDRPTGGAGWLYPCSVVPIDCSGLVLCVFGVGQPHLERKSENPGSMTSRRKMPMRTISRIVPIVLLDMTIMQSGFIDWMRWMPTMWQHGVRATQQMILIVRCFVKHITGQKETDNSLPQNNLSYIVYFK